MILRKNFLLIAALQIILISDFVHARVYIDITSPVSKRFPVAIPDFKVVEGNDTSGQLAGIMNDILVSDLTYSGFFDILDRKSYIEDSTKLKLTEKEINFKDWSVVGAEGLVKGGIILKGNDLIVEIRLFDVILERTIIAQRYVGKAEDVRRIMHRFANDVIESLTGEKGIFDTKLLFVSDAAGNKEIYLSDYDGYNVKQVTHNRSINISPYGSPDGRSILYTSYKEGQPYIYLFELYSGKEFRIAAYDGINIGARWSPNGKEIAMTLSKDGNPELYVLNLETKEMRRITNNSGIDVSPTFSPDGKKIAFVSDISGNPHIYVVNSDGTNMTRLTFDGKYNASPAWSPKGDKIAFARLDGGSFDIWIMNTDGGEQIKLTSNSGNNENPSWSPNGRYIVFSSTREGRAVYIMRADGGGIQRKVTRDTMRQMEPAWSPFQR